MMVFLIILFIVFIVGAMGFLIWISKPKGEREAIKSDATESSTADVAKQAMNVFKSSFNKSNPETSQEFLPFEKIEDSMIYLGEGMYRMMIEVGSLNYYLRTEEEQETVEQQFRRAIGGWYFPWAMYIQTREIDNRVILNTLQQNISESVQKYPGLEEYGKDHLEFIRTLPEKYSNSLIKKKYIIITSDDYSGMSSLTEEERQDYALRQCFERASVIISSLASMGLNAHICKTDELAEIMYIAINKKAGGEVDGLREGDFLSGIVVGRNADESKFTNDKINLIIDEFLNKLDVEVASDRTSTVEEQIRARDFAKRARRLMNGLEPPEENPNDSYALAIHAVNNPIINEDDAEEEFDL